MRQQVRNRSCGRFKCRQILLFHLDIRGAGGRATHIHGGYNLAIAGGDGDGNRSQTDFHFLVVDREARLSGQFNNRFEALRVDDRERCQLAELGFPKVAIEIGRPGQKDPPHRGTIGRQSRSNRQGIMQQARCGDP